MVQSTNTTSHSHESKSAKNENLEEEGTSHTEQANMHQNLEAR
jgi:hypothetical protein